MFGLKVFALLNELFVLHNMFNLFSELKLTMVSCINGIVRECFRTFAF